MNEVLTLIVVTVAPYFFASFRKIKEDVGADRLHISLKSWTVHKFTAQLSWHAIIITERDGRKGPPAEKKARCNRMNTPHSKATRRKAKPNQKPQTHKQGKRQA
jgi:hypothetical protein